MNFGLQNWDCELGPRGVEEAKWEVEAGVGAGMDVELEERRPAPNWAKFHLEGGEIGKFHRKFGNSKTSNGHFDGTHRRGPKYGKDLRRMNEEEYFGEIYSREMSQHGHFALMAFWLMLSTKMRRNDGEIEVNILNKNIYC